MTDEENLAGTAIYRFISDHNLTDGDTLPELDRIAASTGSDATAIKLGLDVACRSGVVQCVTDGQYSVRSLSAIPGQEWLSFSHSATTHGEEVSTIILEASRRLPKVDPEDPIATEFDRDAHAALGLNEGEAFIVISRVRLLSSPAGNDPRVVHRSYLNPHRFPDTFVDDHDFANESLVGLYNAHGFMIGRRYAAARARLACPAERSALGIELRQPVLDLAQRTLATTDEKKTPFVLEYLRATYWNLTFDFER
jgi:DNA-binding GntR family transcriptional regulator